MNQSPSEKKDRSGGGDVSKAKRVNMNIPEPRKYAEEECK